MTGRVVEVMPNVSGEITAIPVQANVLVKTGDVLFRSIRAVQYKVAQLEARWRARASRPKT